MADEAKPNFALAVELSANEIDAVKRWASAEGINNLPFETALQGLFYDRLHRLMLRQVEPTNGY